MQKLHPNAVWLFFLHNIFSFFFSLLFLFIAFGILLAEGDAEVNAFFANIAVWIVAFFLAVVILSFIWAKLTYYFYRYELAETGFKKESGVIWKRYVTIPYNRIQNVDIHRGILARILGLSDLQIQTAGASAVVTRYGASGLGSEGRLPAIDKATAEQLRDDLVNRARTQGQGL